MIFFIIFFLLLVPSKNQTWPYGSRERKCWWKIEGKNIFKKIAIFSLPVIVYEKS